MIKTNIKNQSYPTHSTSKNTTKKKKFVKWLDEIKFYDYIGGLSVKEDRADEILNMLDEIKKNLSFKKPTY